MLASHSTIRSGRLYSSVQAFVPLVLQCGHFPQHAVVPALHVYVVVDHADAVPAPFVAGELVD